MNVLAQLDTDATSYRFPLAVVDSVSLANSPYAVKLFPEKSTRHVGLFSDTVMKTTITWSGPTLWKTMCVFTMSKTASASSSPDGMEQYPPLLGTHLLSLHEISAFKFTGMTRWLLTSVTEHSRKAERWGFGRKRIPSPISMILLLSLLIPSNHRRNRLCGTK